MCSNHLTRRQEVTHCYALLLHDLEHQLLCLGVHAGYESVFHFFVGVQASDLIQHSKAAHLQVFISQLMLLSCLSVKGCTICGAELAKLPMRGFDTCWTRIYFMSVLEIVVARYSVVDFGDLDLF